MKFVLMKETRLYVVALVLAGLLVDKASPQSATVSVNNQALFGLGAVLLASGVAYHVGRNNGLNQVRGGNNGVNQFRSGNRNRGNSGFPFFFRRRRQAVQAREEVNYLDPLVGQLFQTAVEKDTTGCSLQLSCAVGGIPPVLLNGHVKDLHRVLSSTPEDSKLEGKTSWSGMKAHKTALNFGRDGGACEQLFPYCPHSSDHLLDVFQKLQVLEKLE